MPLIHDPEDPKGGPGSAFLSTSLSSKIRRRRKKKTTPPQQHQQKGEGLIGVDLLDWHDELVDVQSPAPIKPSLKTPAKKMQKKRSASTNNNATQKPKRLKDNHVESSSTTKLSPITPMTTSPLVSDTTMTRPVPRVRHALAVDTRALDSEEGMAIFANVRDQALAFLSILAKRGAAPSILACSTQAAVAKSPRGTMQATAMRMTSLQVLAALKQQETSQSLLQAIPIRPPVNAKNVQNRKAVLVPKRMLAHDSWKLFGEMGTSFAVLFATLACHVYTDSYLT